LHSGGEPAAQVLEEFGRGAFARDDHWNSRRVRGDLLGGDVPELAASTDFSPGKILAANLAVEVPGPVRSQHAGQH
jgi:hypothetical protein